MVKGMYPGLSGPALVAQKNATDALVALANRLMHSEVLVSAFSHQDGRLSIEYEENAEQGAES
jgi:hypothetical protein